MRNILRKLKQMRDFTLILEHYKYCYLQVFVVDGVLIAWFGYKYREQFDPCTKEEFAERTRVAWAKLNRGELYQSYIDSHWKWHREAQFELKRLCQVRIMPERSYEPMEDAYEE
jgi:hypothetical protein